ncbi:unnamed protein product, partial [marine sediment metagenome]
LSTYLCLLYLGFQKSEKAIFKTSLHVVIVFSELCRIDCAILCLIFSKYRSSIFYFKVDNPNLSRYS